jgi:hypothetical protein
VLGGDRAEEDWLEAEVLGAGQHKSLRLLIFSSDPKICGDAGLIARPVSSVGVGVG